MKYHPLRKEADSEVDYSHNRDYIGRYWNRKYIRAVQAVLNSTKGQIGKGQSFFYEAFGKNEDEYIDLLEMPESFILYRFFFKWLDNINGLGPIHWHESWNKCKEKLSDEEWKEVLNVIHGNDFSVQTTECFDDADVRHLLSFYKNFRSDISTPGTELYELKKDYDSHPIIELRRNKHHEDN
jgi:hypothetical protein